MRQRAVLGSPRNEREKGREEVNSGIGKRPPINRCWIWSERIEGSFPLSCAPLFYVHYGPTNENAMHSFCERADDARARAHVLVTYRVRAKSAARTPRPKGKVFANMRGKERPPLISRLTPGLSSLERLRGGDLSRARSANLRCEIPTAEERNLY